MFSVIEDIILFFLVMYVIKGVLRTLLPFMFKAPSQGNFKNQGNPFQTRSGQNPFGNNSQYTSGKTESKPEGKIEVEYIPPRKGGKGGHYDGDFIDYEEVKK